MSDTLPKGWVGNDTDHHLDVLGLRLEVHAITDNRKYLPTFGRKTYHWYVMARVGGVGVGLLRGPKDGHESAAQARADGLAAVEAFAKKLLEQAAQLRAGGES
jgi:hypothetical protein